MLGEHRVVRFTDETGDEEDAYAEIIKWGVLECFPLSTSLISPHAPLK